MFAVFFYAQYMIRFPYIPFSDPGGTRGEESPLWEKENHERIIEFKEKVRAA